MRGKTLQGHWLSFNVRTFLEDFGFLKRTMVQSSIPPWGYSDTPFRRTIQRDIAKPAGLELVSNFPKATGSSHLILYLCNNVEIMVFFDR